MIKTFLICVATVIGLVIATFVIGAVCIFVAKKIAESMFGKIDD